MLRDFHPEINKFTTFPHHVMIWIKSGNGMIEVDFKNYAQFKDKLIFLAPNQPIKFLYGEFETVILEFPNSLVTKAIDFRVLFKHLVQMGHIELSNEKYSVISTFFNESRLEVLDVSTNQWFLQNPFNAEKDEYTIIFDLKDAIDKHFNENWSVNQFTTNINHEYSFIHQLVKNRLGLTIKNLAQRKILIESQKEIALTDKPIQEIAYDIGFKDPPYFNRFFKQQTQLTPAQFRTQFGVNPNDFFLQDLIALIKKNHKTQHETAFYANNFFMSVKTLSRKVKNQLNMTMGDLIRREIIESAKVLLKVTTIKATAWELGFKEANHFSTFFKKYTGMTPSKYQEQH